ncbi:MAG: hypothetical protein JWN88_2527 [Frankiales bacterium]|nr:hypothetical protein [Frankiales bacterium]
MSQLVTGEAVALDLRPAALPSRLIARLLDGLLQFGALVVLFGIATAVSVSVSDAAAQALSLLVLVAVLLVYPITFESLMRGRTPGKAAMGLRVVRDDGGPIGFRQALVRGLANLVEGPVTFFVPAVVVSLLNSHSKRVGDLLAGTVVLRERVAVRGGPVAAMPYQLVDWASQLDLGPLSDDLAVSVRQFIARSGSLTPAAREDLGGRLLRAVTDAVGPPPAGTPGWAVLHAVLAERRRRDGLRLATGPAGASPPAFPPATPGSVPLPGYGPPPGRVPDPPRQAPPGPGPFAAPS